MVDTFLTIAIRFEPTRLNNVGITLKKKGKQIRPNGYGWNKLKNRGIHFLSITAVPADSNSAFLVIESFHDVGEAKAINCLVSQLGQEIREIFGSAGIKYGNDLARFLKKHSIKVRQGIFGTTGLNHRGVPGMTVKRILDEHAFAKVVRDKVKNCQKTSSALDMLLHIRKQLQQPIYANMLVPDNIDFLMPSSSEPGILQFLRIGMRGIVTFTWPYLAVVFVVAMWTLYACGIYTTVFTLFGAVLALMGATLLLYYRLRSKEKADVPDDSLPDYAILEAVRKIEDQSELNHLTGISTMKPGLVRNLVLRIVFWITSELGPLQSRPGFIGDLGTIHVARWLVLPGTDKLLFFSNYSGSWESYIEDFITKSATGLSAIWSNTLGFPRTQNLLFGGAADADRLKRWARGQQTPSQYWYSAYPSLSTRLVRVNAAIRYGLAVASTENDAADWLLLFGSRVRRPESIESHEIQSILFGGMGNLRDATCFVLQLPDNAAKARLWLKRIASGITFGDRPPLESAQIIAFTKSGIEKLGKGAVLAEFPSAFRQGMTAAGRSENVLNDTDKNDPARWCWGSGSKEVDAALVVYARSDGSKTNVDRVSAKAIKCLKRNGGHVVAKIPTRRLPKNRPVRGAFGFVDGVSQPIIRGTSRWTKEINPLHGVEPGEFILGYPDNRGYLPLSPTVSSNCDPKNVLPAYRRNVVLHEWPAFSNGSGNKRRDIGKNGSYLVIRQMEQDVKNFDTCIARYAMELRGHPRIPKQLNNKQRAEWLKAKMVGRWPDGTSIVKYPRRPGTGWSNRSIGNHDFSEKVVPDNSFLLGEEDPEGFRCPFSAHIRRANPRDSFSPRSTEQLGIVNRHRILRIGRSYGPEYGKNPNWPRGLLFMCLNGDLERQFEFIQQTWMMSRQFHGLTGEVDPIVGPAKKSNQFTIPTAQGPVVISGFDDFVTVKGGAYFFLPGRSAIRFFYT